MHTVYKDSSSTTKIKVVFDTSAPSTNDNSLNDILLVKSTVYPPLVYVLLHFRLPTIALSADYIQNVPCNQSTS